MVPREDYSGVQAQVLAAMDEAERPRIRTLVDDDGKEVEVEVRPANGLWTEEDEVG